MIIVTGATGALNGATVDRLLMLGPPEDIVVAVRDVTKAQRFADLGIEVRHGDYADPDSLPSAFESADQLLLVSSSDPTADAVQLHRTAINAAVTAGVGRILYTSHQGTALDTRARHVPSSTRRLLRRRRPVARKPPSREPHSVRDLLAQPPA